jgi:anti-sigma factor RsiW
MLLPWYVTGRLTPEERARVEIHLSGCEACQAELGIERQLHARIADLPLDVERGWASMSRLLERERGLGRAAHRPAFANVRRRFSARPLWLGWAVAAQVGVLTLLGAFVVTHEPTSQPARYHVLGAAPETAAADAMAIFKPDVPEHRLRELLQASHAQLVGGPTEAGAYVLHLPPAERAADLAWLRNRPEVETAQPVDGTSAP